MDHTRSPSHCRRDTAPSCSRQLRNRDAPPHAYRSSESLHVPARISAPMCPWTRSELRVVLQRLMGAHRGELACSVVELRAACHCSVDVVVQSKARRLSLAAPGVVCWSLQLTQRRRLGGAGSPTHISLLQVRRLACSESERLRIVIRDRPASRQPNSPRQDRAAVSPTARRSQLAQSQIGEATSQQSEMVSCLAPRRCWRRRLSSLLANPGCWIAVGVASLLHLEAETRQFLLNTGTTGSDRSRSAALDPDEYRPRRKPRDVRRSAAIDAECAFHPLATRRSERDQRYPQGDHP